MTNIMSDLDHSSLTAVIPLCSLGKKLHTKVAIFFKKVNKTLLSPNAVNCKHEIFWSTYCGRACTSSLFESIFTISTKTDDLGAHLGGEGHWGLCGPTCPLESSTFSTSTTTLSSSNSLPSTSSLSPSLPAPSSTSRSSSCTSPTGTSGVCVSPALCIGADLANLGGQRCSLPAGGRGIRS